MTEKFGTAKEQMTSLARKIPVGQYYRFHDHWKIGLQRLSFLGSLLVYLEKDQLATREEIAELLGVKLKWKDGFHMDLDDYLIGLLNLASELARYAINCVTAGDYSRPMKISSFVSELDTAFRLLNLKNDFLRKRFDGLKYDVKKIEEVVYDLTIRGLTQSSGITQSSDMAEM